MNHRFLDKLVSCVCLGAAFVYGQAPKIGNCTVLPANNIWNTSIDQLPVAPNSSTYVNIIGPALPLHPDFGSGTYGGGPIGIPFVTVPASQTKYPVTFTYASESDPGPYAVPLNAPIEGGSQSTGDRHAIAVDTGNCILYELYAAYPQSASWTAGSGAIFNLLLNALRTASWTSADAAGLPIFPGLIRYDEILSGEIRHAIRFTVSKTQKAYVWPARHYASSITDPSYPPMGVRFRLRANFDISHYSSTNQIILTALKKYGMMIADNGASWFISGAPDSRWNNDDLHALTAAKGSDFEAVDVSSLMVDPNSGEAAQAGVSVAVTPPSAAVAVNTTAQFHAAVRGSSDQTVTWSVNGAVGGNSVTGWIDATGLYTAPNSIPAPASVNVQATSRSAPSAVGTATVTITAAVRVTVAPATATLRTGRTHQFKATVENSTNHAVTWEVNGVAGGDSTVGTVSSSGLYRAPSSLPSTNPVTISAVSVADPMTAGHATVKIVRR